MTAKPETKRVYNQGDLASLVAGDRVKLDFKLDFPSADEKELFAYEGVSEGRVKFLTYNDSNGNIERAKIKFDNLSFDGLGNLVVKDLSLEDCDFYSPDHKTFLLDKHLADVEKDLALLQQAGLYRG